MRGLRRVLPLPVLWTVFSCACADRSERAGGPEPPYGEAGSGTGDGGARTATARRSDDSFVPAPSDDAAGDGTAPRTGESGGAAPDAERPSSHGAGPSPVLGPPSSPPGAPSAPDAPAEPPREAEAARPEEGPRPRFLPARVVDLRQVDVEGNARVALLVETDDALLAMSPYVYLFIGGNEGFAMYRARAGHGTPRPMTHELLASTVRSIGGRVRRLAVVDIREGTFYGSLRVELAGGGTVEIDCRPSDGIAVALLSRAPIVVSESVVRAAGRAEAPDELDALDEERIGAPPASLRDSI